MTTPLRRAAGAAGLLLVLAATPHLWAQSAGDDPPPRRGLRQNQGRPGGGLMMRGRGANVDFAAIAQRLLERFDEDKDKKLDSKELAAALESMRGMMGRPGGPAGRDADNPRGRRGGERPGANPEAMLDRLFRADANQDGKLSGDELPERMRSNLERFDTDGDGAIDRKEAEAIFQRMRNRGGRGGDAAGGGRPGGDAPRRPPLEKD